jgi:DNA-directed RNA polymerase subunit RPC12/RpoP
MYKCSECGGVVQVKTTDLKTIVYECIHCGRTRKTDLKDIVELPVINMSDTADLQILME